MAYTGGYFSSVQAILNDPRPKYTTSPTESSHCPLLLSSICESLMPFNFRYINLVLVPTDNFLLIQIFFKWRINERPTASETGSLYRPFWHQYCADGRRSSGIDFTARLQVWGDCTSSINIEPTLMDIVLWFMPFWRQYPTINLFWGSSNCNDGNFYR